MAKRKRQGVRFARIRGRIVPIGRKNKHARAGKQILSPANLPQLATIGAATGAGLGGLFAAGRIEKTSQALLKLNKVKKSNMLNRVAKFTKFGSKAFPALIAASALSSIDRKVRDEGTIFDIGNKQGAFNIATAVLGGYAFARFGKRFEKFGLRGGKFPKKLRDI